MFAYKILWFYIQKKTPRLQSLRITYKGSDVLDLRYLAYLGIAY